MRVVRDKPDHRQTIYTILLLGETKQIRELS